MFGVRIYLGAGAVGGRRGAAFGVACSERRAGMDFRQGGHHGFLGELLVMVRLKIEPDCGRPAEVAFETQGGIDGDRPLALDDLIDAARGHP